MGIRTIRPPLVLPNGVIAGLTLDFFTPSGRTSPSVVAQPNTHPVLSWLYYTGVDGDALTVTLVPISPTANTVESILLLSIATTAPANVGRFCYPVPLDSNQIPYRMQLDRPTSAGTDAATIVWAFETNEDGARG